MIYGDNPKDPSGLNIYLPDTDAIYQSGNLYAYALSNPVLFVDPDGNAGKRFHNAAKGYMKDDMPIEDAAREMLTLDTKTVTHTRFENGKPVMYETEEPDLSSLAPIGKIGKAGKVIKSAATYNATAKSVTKATDFIKHNAYNDMRNKLGEKGANQFIDAMNKGVVGAHGQSGIKMLSGKGINIGGTLYQYEVKLIDKAYANYRLYGNLDKKTGQIIFTVFDKARH